MPKKKQTKQTKKPAKNDGKITKKKYIKTKIIGGGKMIQMLTLKEKLDFLKECLKKHVYNINFNTGSEYFQYYLSDETSNSIRPFNDYFLDNFKSHNKTVQDFLSHLQFILLCLYDHDNYDSYTLLKIYYKNHFNSDQNKLFDTIEIDEGKKTILESEAFTYYNKYVNLLNDFILKIISVANGDGAADLDSTDTNAVPDGASRGQEEVAGRQEGVGPKREVEGVAEVAPGEGQGRRRGGGFGIPEQLLYAQPKTAIAPEEEQNIFETGMFDIYNDGIVLLTIDKEEAYNLKVFKSIDNKEDDEISDKQKIINFLNDNKDSLIIRIYKTPENDNHFYDCQIQLMYKLVNILIDNIKLYEDALQDQLKTNLKDKQFILKYKTNLLDKLIAIIFEKFKAKKSEYDNEQQELKKEKEKHEMFRDGMAGGGSGPGEYVTGSILIHGIILQSLKIIAYNNNIQDSDIESKYSEIFKDFFPDKEVDIGKIVEASNKHIPKYGFLKTPSCSNRKDFFQHIINAIYYYTNHDDTKNKNNIDTLIKLSTSYDLIGGDKYCKTTIDKIIDEKGYLISEAYIQASELKEKYSLESDSINPEIGAKIDKNLQQYTTLIDTYINKNDVGLYSDKKYEPTKKAILKIYDEFKTHFDNKINMFSIKGVNLLKPITAKKVVIQ